MTEKKTQITEEMKNFNYEKTIKEWKEDAEKLKITALRAGMIGHYIEAIGAKEKKGKEIITQMTDHFKRQHIGTSLELNALEASILQLEKEKKEVDEWKLNPEPNNNTNA